MTEVALRPASRDACGPQISVCVCTFRRPAWLQRCLASLRAQEGLEATAFEIVVVDNDSKASVANLVDAFAADAPMTVRYVVETSSGVGHARNRAVIEACAALVAFIDDDEVAETGWLRELLSARQRFGADAVLGPVLAAPEVIPHSWILRSGLLDRPRHTTGTALAWSAGRTGNVLFAREQVLAVGGFDPAFATSGGEDSYLFGRLCERAEFRIVWCDEARVAEALPANRLRLTYWLKRYFRGGRTMVRVRAKLYGPAVYWSWGVRGLVGAPLRALAALLALVSGQPRALKFLCQAMGDLGKLVAGIAPVGTGPYGRQRKPEIQSH